MPALQLGRVRKGKYFKYLVKAKPGDCSLARWQSQSLGRSVGWACQVEKIVSCQLDTYDSINQTDFFCINLQPDRRGLALHRRTIQTNNMLLSIRPSDWPDDWTVFDHHKSAPNGSSLLLFLSIWSKPVVSYHHHRLVICAKQQRRDIAQFFLHFSRLQLRI